MPSSLANLANHLFLKIRTLNRYALTLFLTIEYIEPGFTAQVYFAEVQKLSMSSSVLLWISGLSSGCVNGMRGGRKLYI